MAENMVKDMTKNFGKLDKFEGHDFKRWQKKMHFLLATLKVVYVLTTPMLELMEDATVEAIRIREKYMAEDYSSKKFLVSNFNNYKMVDSRPVMEQYNELLRILGQYTQHLLKMDESISGSSIIDKLPPSWKDFKHTLKQGKDDLSLVDAIAWWIDFGATTHVCKDRCWFKTYEPVEDGFILYMGDDYFTLVHGKESVVLEFSFGKSITLFNVLYVPKLRIIHETTAPYTPQKNGVDERKNRALKEMVNSMLSYSGLGDGFWGEAMLTACYLLNRVPNKRNKTGFGVVEQPNDSVSINTIIESKNAIFDENRFSLIPRPKDIILNSDESQRDDHSNDVPSETPKPRKGKRVKKAKSYGSDFQLYLVEGSRDQIRYQYSYCYSIEEDPRTYNEAMQSRDSAFSKKAIDEEIGSIMENNTWVLSDLPPGCKPLGCIWIFKRKMKFDGTIDKFKARLVIQGFILKEGIDYFDANTQVARITTIRLLLALYAIHNLVIHQMDVKTSFLNGDLLEEVSMKQPK
nr:zinc finger, CCHC-type [Tanacetum cinerariifolium]